MLKQTMPSASTATAVSGNRRASWTFDPNAATNGALADGSGLPCVFECVPRYAVLASLVAASMHDIGHDGHNNAFHVATSSDLAMMYNDRSCLESMHASVGLGLLRHARNDILEHIPSEQRKKVADNPFPPPHPS